MKCLIAFASEVALRWNEPALDDSTFALIENVIVTFSDVHRLSTQTRKIGKAMLGFTARNQESLESSRFFDILLIVSRINDLEALD
jgi:hypothetical protein